MAYEIIAAGPVVGGRGTIPHRVVLVGWYDGEVAVKPSRPEFQRFTTHMQNLTEHDLPPSYNGHKSLRSDLYWGHYFGGSDDIRKSLEDACADFGERVKQHMDNYRHDVDPLFVPGRHRGANYGDSSV